MLVNCGIGENENDAEEDGKRKERLVRRHGLPSKTFLKVLGQAAHQSAEGAHERADESVRGEDMISVFRRAFLCE